MQNGDYRGPRTWEEGVDLKLETLLRGQADLTVAFGRIWKAVNVQAEKVKKLETDAKWKAVAIKVGKAAIPFVTGIVAAKWPALGAMLGDLVKAVAAP